MESSKATDRKLPYEKPRLRVISLVAEEVLGISCKHDVGAPGPSTYGCGSTSCYDSGGS